MSLHKFQSTTMGNRNITIEELLNEDELRMFRPALNNVRLTGFGEVILSLKNGYVYQVEVRFKYQDENHRGRNRV